MLVTDPGCGMIAQKVPSMTVASAVDINATPGGRSNLSPPPQSATITTYN